MLEDAIENDRVIVAIGTNDKGKYFDRITLKYQCAAMLIAGCLQQGFFKMKAEDPPQ